MNKLKTEVTLTIMIDIWGRSLSTLEKPTAKTSAGYIKDVKKIIEDEIAEKLNLASVDPGDIVVFQDRQGKLKTSNVSLVEETMARFSRDGKLKPGALVSTITDKLTEYDKEFNDHIKKITIIFERPLSAAGRVNPTTISR